MWGGPHGPPLGVISCHSLEDAPNNSKFLDFSQLHLYFHLVKSFFTFFCNFYKKITVKIFFRPKKQWFFDKNGQNHFFLTNIDIYCFKIVFSMLWEFFWGALHVCMSKIDDVEISSTSVSFLSFRDLEAASEEAMQLRRLIKSSNESLWPIRDSTSKSPYGIGLKGLKYNIARFYGRSLQI